MTTYVIDTDTLSEYQRGHPRLRGRMEAVPREALAVTIISVEEQLTGWYSRIRRARTDEEMAEAYARLTGSVRVLSRLRILSFDHPAIARHRQPQALKLNIGKMHVRIAAIVLEHGATLVTRNLRDFQRVPGLVIEDWTA